MLKRYPNLKKLKSIILHKEIPSSGASVSINSNYELNFYGQYN